MCKNSFYSKILQKAGNSIAPNVTNHSIKKQVIKWNANKQRKNRNKKLRDKTLKIESKAPFLNASPVKIPIIMLTIP